VMPLNTTAARAALVALTALVSACTAIVPEPRESVSGHVSTPAPDTAAASSAIPRPVTRAPSPLPPSSAPPAETYTVVVNGVPVRELLFALARDAALNVDIHPGIRGSVTLNAIDQTLPQILERLTTQVDLRYKLANNLLVIEPDSPFLRTYVVDYITFKRSTLNKVSVSTQVSSGATGGGGDNTSATEVESSSTHDIWETLIESVTAMVDDGRFSADGGAPAPSANRNADPAGEQRAGVDGSGAVAVQPAQAAAAPSRKVIANKEAGLLTVRATERQHVMVQAYLDQVSDSLQRQVLIEATVVEVSLRDQYQAGIDWSKLPINAGLRLSQSVLAGNLASAPFFLLEYANKRNAAGTPTGDLAVQASLLKEFGDVRVISSPKVMTLNNQTALLKVVNNTVYFTADVETTTDANGVLNTTIETTPQTVPEGFVMAVTPQINASDMVTLSIRPTITQIIDFVTDPNPAFTTIANRIPQLQVREFESILRAQSGQIAVLGGLMEDRANKDVDGLPVLSDIEGFGELFNFRNNTFTKTELVVFIRPWVVRKPSVAAGDLSSFQRYLPENLQPKSVLKPQEGAYRK
jgi:MSHA biogenesis protein MshL